MRRWNGWGDDGVDAPLPEAARGFLAERIGPASAPRDASLDAVLASIDAQPPRLASQPGIDTGAMSRLRASFGQSLADWLRLRFGRVGRVVDGVVAPESTSDTRAVLDHAARIGAIVLPVGGATSVVGHLELPGGDRPVLALSTTRLRRLLQVEPESQLATFEAGVAGPDLEAQLRVHGLTLGHYPQSFEYSTLGGWIVTRSSGQQSARYGRIEQLFAGGRLETPVGPLELHPVPASAAGPEVREWVLGSEGRLGVLTEAVVRVRPLPQEERFVGIFLPDAASGIAAARALAQARLGLSMIRLADPVETLTTLRMAGHARALGALERWLAWRGCGEGKSLLLVGATGTHREVRSMLGETASVLRPLGGVSTGTLLGTRWRAQRFRSVYLRNALWAAGYAVETVETALDWPGVAATMHAVQAAGRAALAARGERCHAYTHLSHVYPQGSSVYTTFAFRIGSDFEAAHACWRAWKDAVSAAIVGQRGTISHQHGVGKDHARWLTAEKGTLGLRGIAALVEAFDPQRTMASGNLVP
jgi:alkyldihydroxyacetonephosphate synthase